MTFPVHNHLGVWVILIPPIGALLVGIMIHYSKPPLKGHGIPEAMEAVLIGEGKVPMRVGIIMGTQSRRLPASWGHGNPRRHADDRKSRWLRPTVAPRALRPAANLRVQKRDRSPLRLVRPGTGLPREGTCAR